MANSTRWKIKWVKWENKQSAEEFFSLTHSLTHRDVYTEYKEEKAWKIVICKSSSSFPLVKYIESIHQTSLIKGFSSFSFERYFLFSSPPPSAYFHRVLNFKYWHICADKNNLFLKTFLLFLFLFFWHFHQFFPFSYIALCVHSSHVLISFLGCV